MRYKNVKLTAIVTAILGFGLLTPSVSFAETLQPVSTANDVSSLPSVENGIIKLLGPSKAALSRPDRALKGGQFYSATSSYYLKLGIRRYEKGKLEKAEKAFETVLRTRELKKYAYLYLAHINAQQGDKALEQKYVKAYHSIPDGPIPEWRGPKG